VGLPESCPGAWAPEGAAARRRATRKRGQGSDEVIEHFRFIVILFAASPLQLG